MMYVQTEAIFLTIPLLIMVYIAYKIAEVQEGEVTGTNKIKLLISLIGGWLLACVSAIITNVVGFPFLLIAFLVLLFYGGVLLLLFRLNL
ncbi:hypothetical protein [Pontibacillus marinus]|uniref:Uncharacterized protein n=1 Tax=Pontibacillus marinus BH030004 = DSM 16465 TaxID=1385511 RepID=A0A0A5G413_9BACI|nr:hypothetical protein [Pontibacillus marinus]KGX85830.1 hypothetical protein N783_13785 [Pontibacillus marinus BH030004 = DSM 16465]